MTFEIALVLGILAVAVTLFVMERPRSDVVALMLLGGLAITGLVEPREALSGFSSPAVVTVWAVFILSTGLTKTGVATVLAWKDGSGEEGSPPTTPTMNRELNRIRSLPPDRDILERTLEALELETLSPDRFRADPGGGRRRLFGGLVGAQAVRAAAATVGGERSLHSLHAYFLRPGRPGIAIDLEVERLREGGSYSTRRVTARQDDEGIFVAMASFAVPEDGLMHQEVEMPDVPGPEALPDREIERGRRYRDVLGVELRPYESAVEVRLCDPRVVEPGRSLSARQDNWLRVVGELGADQVLQRAMLVYASDRTLLATARMPHSVGRHRLMGVSLDHSLWVHHDLDLSRWHLCRCVSPAGSGGRGTVMAHLFRRDGVCVATIAQEGLVRVRRGAATR